MKHGGVKEAELSGEAAAAPRGLIKPNSAEGSISPFVPVTGGWVAAGRGEVACGVGGAVGSRSWRSFQDAINICYLNKTKRLL